MKSYIERIFRDDVRPYMTCRVEATILVGGGGGGGSLTLAQIIGRKEEYKTLLNLYGSLHTTFLKTTLARVSSSPLPSDAPTFLIMSTCQKLQNDMSFILHSIFCTA